MAVALFRHEPYQRLFEAQVTTVGPDYLLLDRTCFAPSSAVHAGDLGHIDACPVRGVHWVDGRIQHVLDRASTDNFSVGDSVHASLDWDRRHRIMRLHSAQHLVEAALANVHCSGTTVRSIANADRAQVNIVSYDESLPVKLAEVQSWVRATIADNLPAIHQPDRSVEHRWIWHVDGLISHACDGAHVRSTAEIGDLRMQVLDTSYGKTVLEIELVDRESGGRN